MIIVSNIRSFKFGIVFGLMFFLLSCVAHQNVRNEVTGSGSSGLYDVGGYIDGGYLLPAATSGKKYLRLLQPVSVAAWLNYIYIADAGHDSVLRFDTNTKDITVFYSVEISDKTRIMSTDTGNLYISDYDNSRILYLDNTGRLIRELADSNLINPVAIVEDNKNSRILMVDGIHDYLLSFNLLGRLFNVLSLDSKGQELITNIVSMDIAADRIYLLDHPGRMVFIGNAKNTHPDSFYSFGNDVLKLPVAVQAAEDGRVFVGDAFDGSIVSFQVGRDKEGVFKVMSTDTLDADILNLSDMLLHESWLYVVDSASARIRLISVEPK